MARLRYVNRNPGINPRLWRMISQNAPRFNLDPRAVAAVSKQEGGGRFGAVGDAGTSFGPFQLHRGGALPAGRGAGWANSEAGVRYAMRAMANAGARGLSGRQAISAIVNRFERPREDLRAGEITRAWDFYQKAGANPVSQQYAGQATAFETGYRAKTAEAILPTAQLGLIAKVGPLSQRAAEHIAADAQARLPNAAPIPGVKVQKGRSLRAGTVQGERVTQIAAKQLGQPYVWGGESRKEGGFDCSGLIQWAYGKMGVKMPRLAGDQGHMGRAVRLDREHLRPGDLIVARDRHHIVMYVGGGKVIAAPQTGELVQYQSVDPFLNAGWKARRIFDNRRRRRRR